MTDLRAYVDKLRAAGVADPAGDVRRLADWAKEDGAKFEAAIAARAGRKPVSQITGRRAFWKHEFIVTPDVLDPRPETETLVEAALAAPFRRVLDLGTGSGCIVISLLLERPEARGVGTDNSEAAVLVAGENADRLGVVDRLTLPLSDWFEDVGSTYDLIVSNPPYITVEEMNCLQPEVRLHEPRSALTDDANGLSAYHAIASGAPAHLTPGGRLLVEIGPNQASYVAGLFAESGLAEIDVLRDLDGRDRVVMAKNPVDNCHS